MKPVIPGCLCIMVGIKPPNLGKCVTAVKFVGTSGRQTYTDLWLIDPPLDGHCHTPYGDYPTRVALVSVRHLLRIDGGDEELQQEQIERLRDAITKQTKNAKQK